MGVSSYFWVIFLWCSQETIAFMEEGRSLGLFFGEFSYGILGCSVILKDILGLFHGWFLEGRKLRRVMNMVSKSLKKPGSEGWQWETDPKKTRALSAVTWLKNSPWISIATSGRWTQHSEWWTSKNQWISCSYPVFAVRFSSRSLVPSAGSESSWIPSKKIKVVLELATTPPKTGVFFVISDQYPMSRIEKRKYEGSTGSTSN